MRNIKNRIKNINGITLIALVITIVVLVILAAVIISISLGNDGLIARAIKAAKGYKDAQERDKQSINDLYGELVVASDGTISGLTSDQLQNIINTAVNNKLTGYQRLRSNSYINVPLNDIGENNNVTTGFTAPTDGYYTIGTNFDLDVKAYAMCVVKHFLSDKTTLIEQYETSGINYSLHGGCNIYMKKGEYITIYRQKNVTIEFSRFWYAEGCVPTE